MGKREAQNRATSPARAPKAFPAEEMNDADFVSDADYLETDGSTPEYSENCTHERLGDPPEWDVFRVTACKDCGQMMITDPKKSRQRGWYVGRGKVTLPVTLEKCVSQMLINAFNTKPSH